jgi:hypothetical protein
MRPIRANIAACAREPLISWRHSLRSKPIEALISCITTDGPAAKRPPHCWFAVALRRSDGSDVIGVFRHAWS